MFFFVRSYPNSKTNDNQLGKDLVNTEDDRKFPNPILVFSIASDLQCVGDHYHVRELACLYSLVSAD